MIMNTKTITVLGALGAQGRSVVNTFLADGSFHVRGVTRSVDSPASKDLAEQGVNMMAGDVKDPASLSHALTGADIAFVVVNFWDPDIGIQEGKLTKAIFEEAKKAGVQHVIYSSLANVKKMSGGDIAVPHFTLKGEAWEHLQTMGFESVTAVEPAAYYSNWFSFFKAVEDESGTLVWTWPGKKNHVFSQFDVNTGVGSSVLAAAKDPSKYNLQNILLEGEKRILLRGSRRSLVRPEESTMKTLRIFPPFSREPTKSRKWSVGLTSMATLAPKPRQESTTVAKKSVG